MRLLLPPFPRPHILARRWTDMTDDGDLSRRVTELETWRGEFNDGVIDRLARIETKLDGIKSNGNGGAKPANPTNSMVADVLKALTYLVVGLVGVLTGRQIQ